MRYQGILYIFMGYPACWELTYPVQCGIPNTVKGTVNNSALWGFSMYQQSNNNRLSATETPSYYLTNRKN